MRWMMTIRQDHTFILYTPLLFSGVWANHCSRIENKNADVTAVTTTATLHFWFQLCLIYFIVYDDNLTK
jgi:hypothetical protein